jgi:hypothetical protein
MEPAMNFTIRRLTNRAKGVDGAYSISQETDYHRTWTAIEITHQGWTALHTAPGQEPTCQHGETLSEILERIELYYTAQLQQG